MLCISTSSLVLLITSTLYLITIGADSSYIVMYVIIGIPIITCQFDNYRLKWKSQMKRHVIMLNSIKRKSLSVFILLCLWLVGTRMQEIWRRDKIKFVFKISDQFNHDSSDFNSKYLASKDFSLYAILWEYIIFTKMCKNTPLFHKNTRWVLQIMKL